MSDSERFVVLGLASTRVGWFSEVSRWATSAAIPVDFLKCISADEVRARLNSGRRFSALLVDGDLTSLDRDLVSEAGAVGVAVLVVGGRAQKPWSEMGVAATLAPDFTRDDLVTKLHDHAAAIARVERHDMITGRDEPSTSWRGRLIAVTGPGGAGSSTIAMAIAQELGSEASNRGLIALADLALHADLAMLHDARDVTPGIQEMVEAHRGSRLPLDEMRAMMFADELRPYHLLLGLRRHRDWTAIRRRAFSATLDSLLGSYRVVVTDIDPDLEGENLTGSPAIEDRNLMARTCVERADIVVLVGRAGLKGLHSLVRQVHDYLDAGYQADRLVVVINHVPRSPRRRAEFVTAFDSLISRVGGASGIGNPLLVGDRRDVEDSLRDGVALPSSLAKHVVVELQRRLDATEPRSNSADLDIVEPVAITPGSLGAWADQGDEGGVR